LERHNEGCSEHSSVGYRVLFHVSLWSDYLISALSNEPRFLQTQIDHKLILVYHGGGLSTLRNSHIGLSSFGLWYVGHDFQ
jgi:hypothetical protein